MTVERARTTLVEIGLDDPRWPAFLGRSPGATIFHSPAWVRTIADSYGFRGFGLGVVDDHREIRGLLPMAEVDLPLRSRRWVSLPFTDVCPPLLGAGLDVAAVTPLLELAAREAGVSSIEVRAPLAGTWLHERGVEHVLPLGSKPDELRRRFKKQAWQKVKQAQRQNLQIREAARAEDLLDTYYGLHLATRRRQGVPCQPRRFFERLWENVFEPGRGLLLIAEHDGTPAGGAVFLAGSSTLVYKYSASLPALWSLRPNNLLIWVAMQWGIAHGCEQIHFGRSDADNQGLRAFKSAWGAEESPLAYSTVGTTGGGSLPHVPGLGKVVELAIRSSPPVVCRRLGEVLYRFAA